MLSRWAQTITPDRLAPAFGRRTVDKGRQYALEGRVAGIEWEGAAAEVLRGSCVDSDGARYESTINFSRVGESWKIGSALCTCPVRMYCKHCVAVLLTAASAPDDEAAGEPTWEAVVTSILSESEPTSAGHSLALLVIVNDGDARLKKGPTVHLRPMTSGANGAWVRTGISWRTLLGRDVRGEFDAEGFRALQQIVHEESGEHRQSYVSQDHLDLGAASASIWKALESVVAAGVPLIPDPATQADRVELGHQAVLGLDIGPGDTTAAASLDAHLLVDDESWDLTRSHLLGAPHPHGVFRVAGRVLTMAPFDPVPPQSLVDLAGSTLRAQIPVKDADHFLAEVLPRLQASVPVRVADNLFAPPEISGPTPVLTVSTTGDGIRTHWTLRYWVNDDQRDFDPTARIVAGYRNRGAEDAMWQNIIEVLRKVAAVSSSWSADALATASARSLTADLELSGVQAAMFHVEVLPQIVEREDIIVEQSDGAADFRRSDAGPQLQFSAPEAQSAGNDWFDLHITATVDGEQVPLADLIRELSAGATHMLLPSGTYFPLDSPELVRLVALLDEGRALGEIEGGKAKASSYNVTLWEELLELGVVDEQTRAWQQTLARLRTARPPCEVEPPRMLRADLRPYQRDGLNWLSFLWDNGFGGILADDMGLGKTLQTLALIGRLRENSEVTEPFLVVAPTSVIANWLAECDKFAPELSAVAVTSTEAKSGRSLRERVAGADIVITSYTLLRIDFEVFDDLRWAGLILDEAQFVKNHNAKAHQCARRLDIPFKLAITGTPMENNLMELWSLLSITAPGLFPKPKKFTEFFRRPIESGAHPERLATLRRRIKPMMLRRTKDQVATDLPPKQEQVVPVVLDAKHQKIYDTRLSRERQKVLGLLGDWEKNRFEIFRSLTMLRQLSLHAALVDESKREVPSAKIDFLIEQLPELLAEGHSALVFSQFTGFLSLIREHLDAEEIAYSYLDGSMTAAKRVDAIADFTAGKTQVFLISLKAGGFGLNLTEADYCFVCDPWWNPAAEAQAVDRAHRIGQTRPVTVYRLVSAGTIEEKVVALQERKRELFNAVMDEGEMFGRAIGAEDIRELLGVNDR